MASLDSDTHLAVQAYYRTELEYVSYSMKIAILVTGWLRDRRRSKCLDCMELPCIELPVLENSTIVIGKNKNTGRWYNEHQDASIFIGTVIKQHLL